MLMLCVYTCTQTHSCTVYPVVMSNIGTNMYGGNIGSLMLCVYTCTQTHSCTVYPVAMSNIGTNMYGGNIGSLMLCVYTCTQTHSCTVYPVAMSNISTNMYGGNNYRLARSQASPVPVCIDSDKEKLKSSKNWEGLGSFIT